MTSNWNDFFLVFSLLTHRSRRRCEGLRATEHEAAECRLLRDRWRSDQRAEHTGSKDGGTVDAVPGAEAAAAHCLRAGRLEVCAASRPDALGRDQSDQGRVLPDPPGGAARWTLSGAADTARCHHDGTHLHAANDAAACWYVHERNHAISWEQNICK